MVIKRIWGVGVEQKSAGSILKTGIEIKMNIKKNILQLCPNNNIASDPDQSCFEQYQLQVILDRNDPIARNDYKKHFLHNTLQIPQ